MRISSGRERRVVLVLVVVVVCGNDIGIIFGMRCLFDILQIDFSSYPLSESSSSFILLLLFDVVCLISF